MEYADLPESVKSDLDFPTLSDEGQRSPSIREWTAEKIETRRRFLQCNDDVAPCHIKDNPRRGRGRSFKAPKPVATERQHCPNIYVEHLPALPLCADDYRQGSFVLPRDMALNYQHIQFNRPKSYDWLVLDVDRDEAYRAAEDADLQAPNVIMVNPDNGHAHLAWLLARPVLRFNSSRREPLEYFAAIQRGYRRRLGADRAYSGTLTKNPAHRRWRVQWNTLKAYSLEDLDAALLPGDKKPEPRVALEVGEGRNVTIFDAIRTRGYRWATSSLDDLSAIRPKLAELAFDINDGFEMPLSEREVVHIINSVAGWIERKFSAEAFSRMQSARARKRWSGHISDRSTEPWKALGISRRTYYRHKAKGLIAGPTGSRH